MTPEITGYKKEKIGTDTIMVCVFAVILIFFFIWIGTRPTGPYVTNIGGQRYMVIPGNHNPDGPVTYLYTMAGNVSICSIMEPIPDFRKDNRTLWFFVDTDGMMWKTTSFSYRRINR
jgi:hypothetical protein